MSTSDKDRSNVFFPKFIGLYADLNKFKFVYMNFVGEVWFKFNEGVLIELVVIDDTGLQYFGVYLLVRLITLFLDHKPLCVAKLFCKFNNSW